MNRKNSIKSPVERMLTRLHVGCVNLQHHPQLYAAVLAYLIFICLVATAVMQPTTGDPLTVLAHNISRALLPVYAIAGLLALIILFGIPRGAIKASRALARAGITNAAGESPMLLTVRHGKADHRILNYEFDANDLPLAYWQDHQAEIEAALNVNIINIQCSRGKHRIWIFCVPASGAIPDFVELDSAIVPARDSELALGEGLAGQMTVDLAKTAHLLIAGNSGSGKTVLMRSLLYQAVEKYYQVYIVDFKGGIDFTQWWHENCHLSYTGESALATMKNLVEELNLRLQTLKVNNCNNIDSYRKKCGIDWPRIIIAFDEIAEALDKTGADKDRKSYIAELERCLTTISRLGRACGIHLIIGVQRPDVNAVPPQIKTNLSYRCCSRADNVLSMIALDNTRAADEIPKDSQGRFIDGEGNIFQAYYLDDSAPTDY